MVVTHHFSQPGTNLDTLFDAGGSRAPNHFAQAYTLLMVKPFGG